MAEEIPFYSRASGSSHNKEDWYTLVVPDDGSKSFVEHTWAVLNAVGETEYNGTSGITVADFLSKDYPEDAKTSLRSILTSKSL